MTAPDTVYIYCLIQNGHSHILIISGVYCHLILIYTCDWQIKWFQFVSRLIDL